MKDKLSKLEIKEVKGDLEKVLNNEEDYENYAIIELPDFKNEFGEPLRAMIFNNNLPNIGKGRNFNMLAKYRMLHDWNKVDIFICQHAETITKNKKEKYSI